VPVIPGTRLPIAALMRLTSTRFITLRLLACGIFASTVDAAELTVPAGATLQIPGSATLQLGCADLNTAGSALVNAGLIQQAGNVTIAATGALNGGAGTIQVGGNWRNNGTFIAGSGTVMFVDGCSTAPASLAGDTQFNHLILTSQTGRTFVIEAGRNIGVSGSLIVQGTPAAPVNLVTSSQSGQVAYITLAAGATYSATDATIPPNVRIVDPTPPPPPPPNPIPALGEWGRLWLMLVLALAAHAGAIPRKNLLP
jgi:hypothetical protein